MQNCQQTKPHKADAYKAFKPVLTTLWMMVSSERWDGVDRDGVSPWGVWNNVAASLWNNVDRVETPRGVWNLGRQLPQLTRALGR